jgi:hypothetical protein
MLSASESVSSELKGKYEVDEFFYPDISMNIQIPDGLKGEISEIIRLLEKNDFEASSSNVYQVMQLKKKLLTEYRDNSKRGNVLKAYRELLGKRIRPVGSTIPIELVLVDGLMVILLSIVARFGLSFADEAGKIAARKLLDKGKKQAKRHNMTLEEYNFLKTETVAWIDEGKSFGFFTKQIKKKKKES